MARPVTWLADTNVWLALALSHHQHHITAATWLDEIAARSSVIVCRAVQQSLLRLLTTAAVFAPYGNQPLTNTQAWNVLEALVDDDRIVPQSSEPSDLGQRWHEYSRRDTSSPKLWMDAYLAAFARSGGHTLVTTDMAFVQFADLDVVVLER